jgi:hypothetical protein
MSPGPGILGENFVIITKTITSPSNPIGQLRRETEKIDC